MNRTQLVLSLILIPACRVAFPAEPAAAAITQLADDYFAKRPNQSLHAGLSLEEALRVQRKFVTRLIPKLGAPVGFKVGLTSKAVQESLGASAPVRGVLLADMLLKDGAHVAVAFGARPIWEPDLMVVVKDAAINQAKTPLEVAQHLSEIVAFLELPDRIIAETEKLDGNLITALNASARLGVLGQRVTVEPTAGFVAALGKLSVKATDQNGAELASASGDALLGHPLNPVLWLINDLAATGERLKAGDLISLGSFARPQAPQPGQTITVRYEGLPGGPLKVSVRFTDFSEPVKPTVHEAAAASTNGTNEFQVSEDDEQIVIATSTLEAAVRKKGYVTGIAAGSFLDKRSGFRDAGYGLDIVDWIMEPGSDEAYRDQLTGDLAYLFNNSYHGKSAKRSIEGPQICTKAMELSPRVVRGKDFVAIASRYKYQTAAPGKQTGSEWSQVLVFPAGQRYFLSSDTITSVNASDAMFLRLDMPGHIKHTNGDTFSEVYLSYAGTIPSSEFVNDFAPDERFNYRRDANPAPKRFIRAYHLRDPRTGRAGPWLAGMTLDPSVVYEAWCHQRGYVCLIEEFGGRPIRPGESFSAAFIVGFFDSIEEMEKVYDRYAGHTGLEVSTRGWRLTR